MRARKEGTMDRRSRETVTGPEEIAGPADRPRPDATVGLGNMPADLGASDRPVIDEPDGHEFDPGPISGHQHDLEHVEPRTDSATAVHPVGDLPAEGA
jgi:hypothetical protein